MLDFVLHALPLWFRGGPDLMPSKSGGPPIVAPKLLELHRTAGEKMIHPDGDVMLAAERSGHTIRGSFKLCIDETGHVTNVETVTSTNAPSYDLKLIGGIKRWAYRPVVVDGRATPVCSAATFIFSAR